MTAPTAIPMTMGISHAIAVLDRVLPRQWPTAAAVCPGQCAFDGLR